MSKTKHALFTAPVILQRCDTAGSIKTAHKFFSFGKERIELHSKEIFPVLGQVDAWQGFAKIAYISSNGSCRLKTVVGFQKVNFI